MANAAYDQASDISAEAGEVHVEGPGGIAYSMTPEAAAETSDRLLHGANQAAGQRINHNREKQRNARRLT